MLRQLLQYTPGELTEANSSKEGAETGTFSADDKKGRADGSTTCQAKEPFQSKPQSAIKKRASCSHQSTAPSSYKRVLKGQLSYRSNRESQTVTPREKSIQETTATPPLGSANRTKRQPKHAEAPSSKAIAPGHSRRAHRSKLSRRRSRNGRFFSRREKVEPTAAPRANRKSLPKQTAVSKQKASILQPQINSSFVL